MTGKEKFLAVKTYEEFDKLRGTFGHLNMADKEIREHVSKIFPKVDNYNGELNTIVDDKDKCVIRTGIPKGMTRDEYIDFLIAKRKEHIESKKNKIKN